MVNVWTDGHTSIIFIYLSNELFSEAFQLQLDKPNPTPSTSGAGIATRATTARAAIQQPHPSFIVPPAPLPGPVPAHATEQPRPSPSATTRFAVPLRGRHCTKKKKCHPSKHTERQQNTASVCGKSGINIAVTQPPQPFLRSLLSPQQTFSFGSSVSS